jgi:hypothetical protein
MTPPTNEDWFDSDERSLGYQPCDDLDSLDWQCRLCGAAARSNCRADDPDKCPHQSRERAA